MTKTILLLVLTWACPFQSTFASTFASTDDVNFSELRHYAEFAQASYQPPADIAAFCQQKKFTLDQYNSITDIKINYFLATDNRHKTQIIAVRGTSNVENALIDIALKLIPDKHTGIQLHHGFSVAAQAIYSEIRSKLKPGYTISTTGHSLGGGVALILAMHLEVDHFNVGQIVTFGQPKVTNITGAYKFQHLKISRVVTPRDLVPLVPPFDPVDLNNIGIYWHAGKEIILLEGRHYALLQGINSMLRATRFTQQALSEKNLHSHKMNLYIELLDKKIPTAKLVPYKNSFNLFNLFGAHFRHSHPRVLMA